MAISSKLSARHQAFILDQPLFFVAAAARDDRANLSPKSIDGKPTGILDDGN